MILITNFNLFFIPYHLAAVKHFLPTEREQGRRFRHLFLPSPFCGSATSARRQPPWPWRFRPLLHTCGAPCRPTPVTSCNVLPSTHVAAVVSFLLVAHSLPCGALPQIFCRPSLIGSGPLREHLDRLAEKSGNQAIPTGHVRVDCHRPVPGTIPSLQAQAVPSASSPDVSVKLDDVCHMRAPSRRHVSGFIMVHVR